ncbi:DUF1772 domain-containing protein [Streptomyces sp. NBC_01732]|uniref:DUF1772 domain-containing protein n=1 Tax=unclassified Streptomyces TaxID=2593676 RepID=UPI000FB1C6D0|nr:hypothetical protein EES42_39895 [Streptomyces sp. ADI95-17]
MGAVPLLGLAVVLAWRGHGRSAPPWLIAALVLYLVAFMVTSGVNVPLNDQLARAGDPAHAGQLAAIRADFENKWVLWNVVRALLPGLGAVRVRSASAAREQAHRCIRADSCSGVPLRSPPGRTAPAGNPAPLRPARFPRTWP